MEKLLNIPMLEKAVVKSVIKQAANSCCTSKNETSSCCTPSELPEENEGACCAQPEDGSACCVK